MNMPYGIGCTLVKDRRAHFSTFAYGYEAEYLKSAFDLSEDQLTNPHNLALPLSRNFSSLKAYMLLRANGKSKYGRIVQQNLDQIKYFANLIEKDPQLEITAPVASNVVCFRYIKDGQDEAELEELNKFILDDLYQKAFLMISDTTVKDRYMLRACNVNHRTRMEDMAFLVEKVKAIGQSKASHYGSVKDTTS
jgi:glutamate/tyrosine decarboxylase-like PLP-dependent enzyme